MSTSNVITAIATIKALEDRYALKTVSNKDAKAAWEFLIENEPELFKKVHSIGKTDAVLWYQKIRSALYGDNP